jgi:hypothetical protein
MKKHIRRPRKRLKYSKIKSRRRIQRAFLSWLDKNHHLFAIGVVVESRTDSSLIFSFEGINCAIRGLLNTHELDVWVEWNGYCWDYIFSFDSAPMRTPDGFVCKLCRDYFLDKNPDKQFDAIYRSREEIWKKDIFEPFLEWVNSELAPAKFIGLFGETDHATTVRLLGAPPHGGCSEDLTALLPARSANGD